MNVSFIYSLYPKFLAKIKILLIKKSKIKIKISHLLKKVKYDSLKYDFYVFLKISKFHRKTMFFFIYWLLIIERK
jgi:hypothetical protein